tara:strand:+ start:8516 stop:10174 length:1659 start_codon:yes stop_codon:yes gene_type:complete
MINNQDWRTYHGVLVPSSPPDVEVTTSYSAIRSFLKKNNIIFARWISSFDCNVVMPFWYIINDKPISLEDYNRNTRNQIRKGLKMCKVMMITKETLANSGYNVYLEAFKNYKTFNKIFTKTFFRNQIMSLDNSWEFWGVFNLQGDMIGYSQNNIQLNVCKFAKTKFHPDFLKLRPSEALFYTMCNYYMNKKKFRYIHNGTKNIAHHTNIQDFLIKKFKFRKAYCKLEICYHPAINTLVRVLFPFREIFKYFKFRFFQKIYLMLNLESMRRLSDNIFNNISDSRNQLVLSNGNFKSGSTWVTAIIKELLNHDNYDFPKEYQNPKHNNWINIFKIPSFISSSFFKNKKYWLSKSHIFHESILSKIMIHQNNIKVIHIHRDLRDVLVSHFHHLRNERKYNKKFRSYFYSWGIYKAIQYLYYNKLWKNGPCLSLKYEDLKQNNYKTIKKMAEYLNISVSEKRIKSIQKETEINTLRSNSKIKKLNQEEWFYRKGIVGDWKNYFDDQMLLKLRYIEAGKLSLSTRIIYFIKFTSRIRFKFFLYRFFPFMYKMFDKRF